MSRSPFADAAWTALSQPGAKANVFDPATIPALPTPAQRLLTAALPPGTSLDTSVRLAMDGEIKLGGRWLGFTARQIIRAGVGLVWEPVVGGRFLRFTGADVLGPDGAQIEFKLHGRVPIVRGSGPDIKRSAIGRLAAETVAWLPQALTPQAGARWTGIDEQRAIVTLDAGGTDVEVAVGDSGEVLWLGLDRWRDSAKPPTYAPFGGTIDSTLTTQNGVKIAGSGSVGWEWHTPQEHEGVFFRYRIISALFGDTTLNASGNDAPQTH